MPNISNLKLALQTGTDNTYFATWDFVETTKKTTTTTSGGIASGEWVTIKTDAGATYYNGVGIPSWVFNETWQIAQLSGDRAVLGKSKSGTYNIQSPINTKYLNGGSEGSTNTTTTEEKTNYLDHYEIKWYYATGDGIWFIGTDSSNITEKQAVYNAPSNSTKIKVSVKPVSKTHKVNDQDVSYWTGSWVSKEYITSSNPPEKPSAPAVVIDKYTLTAKIDNVSDPRTDQIYFEIYSGVKRVKTGIVTVQACLATFSCSVTVGEEYRVRCRAINLNNKTKIYSEWSAFSSSIGTIPSAPKSIIELKALSETSVYIDWADVSNATSYEIEYTTKRTYFDSSTEVKKMSVEGVVGHAEVTGMTPGERYFFRVRAVNGVGNSSWSEIKSIVIGKAPSAPTTWSSTTTAITGEPLTLYWVHNSEDGSSQTYAELEIYANGIKETYTIKNTASEEDKDKTSSYAVVTSKYIEGTTLQWRVRTAGITNTYGDWSVQRAIDIYAPPTLELNITDVNGTHIDVLKSFPLYISGLAGPPTQAPIGYHLSVTSNASYETVDNVGNVKMVNTGEAVYAKYFDTSDPLLVELSAGNINLENNIGYTVVCTASMNSGLTSETSLDFTVDWTDVSYEPDAEIGIDNDTYSAYISPYCIDENQEPIADVLLSVYRREFDGSFKELSSGIDTSMNVYIVDPHPSLDYARYRIVATSKTTGAVSYYDPPGYPVGGTSVIIQWDEEWSNFDTTTEDELETPPWSGSLLVLPYNIDVSDSNDPDTALVNYIGRSHPVSYYGTQVGSTSIWSMTIPKDDKDTLYALRRLSIWMGDVYVREPSGSGYWANVTVSFSQKHLDLTIPVTLNVTRVEGGI